MWENSSVEPLEATGVETHPLLRRHYSTIGIGDVFLQAPCDGDEWLPSSYLTASSPPPLPSPPTLYEMTGTIKSTPDDFVVQEMALVRGRMRVADLCLGSELQEAPPTETRRTKVACIRQPVGSDDGQPKDNSTRVELSPPVRDILSFEGCAPESGRTNGECLENERSPKCGETDDPMKILEFILARQQHPANSPLQPPEVSIAALHRLTSESLDTIRRVASGSEANTPLSPPSEVFISFSISSENAQQQKMDKRDIHDAMRDAFPLLIAESAVSETDGICRIRVTVDDCFFALIPSLFAPAEDLPALYAFAKRGYEHTLRQATMEATIVAKKTVGSREQLNHGSRGRQRQPGPTLRLRPDLPRSDRRPVHQLIDSKSKGLLGTATMNDFALQGTDTLTTTTAIAVHWSNIAKRRQSKKRTREESICAGIAPQSNLVLCVVRKRQREHLALINTLSAALRCQKADVNFAGIKDKIALTTQFCTLNKCAAQRISSASGYLRQRGIEVVSLHSVDRALNKGDLIGNRFEIVVRNTLRLQLSYINNTPQESFVPVDEPHLRQMVDRIRAAGFVNFYGEQRVGDPGHESIVGVRAFDIGRAMLQQDFSKAIDLLMTGRRIINGVAMEGDDVELFRRTWKETGGDPIATAKNLSRGSSVPRERAVLQGLLRYGKDNPIAAIRCLQRNERLFFINGYQSYVWNIMATERLRRYGNKVVPGDLLLAEGCNKPEFATEGSKVESIENLVLPMPGFDVLYPANKIGVLYKKFLAQENVQFDKSAPEESKAKGTYRRVVTFAGNLLYELMSTEGTSVDVKFSFDLPKGSYATMFLRELMLKTVARDSTSFS